MLLTLLSVFLSVSFLELNGPIKRWIVLPFSKKDAVASGGRDVYKTTHLYVEGLVPDPRPLPTLSPTVFLGSALLWITGQA